MFNQYFCSDDGRLDFVGRKANLRYPSRVGAGSLETCRVEGCYSSEWYGTSAYRFDSIYTTHRETVQMERNRLVGS